MRISIVVLSAALALGCKGKQNAAATAGSGSAIVAEGSGSALAAPPEQTPVGLQVGSGEGPKVVKLPDAQTSPPPKSTKKLDKAKLDQLAALDWPSFDRTVKQQTDGALVLSYKTKERPVLEAQVIVGGCFDCQPMELAKWQARGEGLKNMVVGSELRDHANTKYELGATDLNGTPAIFTYQSTWAFGKDPETDQQGGSFGTAYNLFYNDGVNQIRVIAKWADDAVRSQDELISLAPKQDLELIAKRFAAAFAAKW